MDNILDVRDRTTRIRDIRAMAGRAMLDGPHDYTTAALEGPLLDLAVANAIGLRAVIHKVNNAIAPFFECCVLSENGRLQYQYTPSRGWTQAGPIIEEKRISVAAVAGGWTAICGTSEARAAEPLLAAMRAFVGQKLGASVRM